MSYTYYADTLITLMLGWIRALTDWIWNIVSLGDGSAGKSFLTWFGSNWLTVVICMLIVGLAADWLIWLVRWKPYWLWFGKKRRILEDADMPAPRSPVKERPKSRERRSDASTRRPVRRSVTEPKDENDGTPIGRTPQPRYQSKALPRKSGVPATAPKYAEPDFEDDELFDVISPEIASPEKETARKTRREDEWIGEYVNGSAKKPGREKAASARTERKQTDEIDWFDS